MSAFMCKKNEYQEHQHRLKTIHYTFEEVGFF